MNTGKTRINADIDTELHKEVKVFAALNELTITEVLVRGLQLMLEKKNSKKAA